MIDTIHYILVRRDLPFGVTLAMVAHAAALSTNSYHRTVAVLGVRNEKELRKRSMKLHGNKVKHTTVFDSNPYYEGQMLSIGIPPASRSELSHLVSDLATYREFEGPEPQDVVGAFVEAQ